MSCSDALTKALTDAGLTDAQAEELCSGLGKGSDAYAGTNTGYLLISAYMVFCMQIGFAMLCAGSVRTKNTMNILLKNVLDACLGAIAWYLTGYAIAFGPSKNAALSGDNWKPGSDNSMIEGDSESAWMQAEFIGESLFAGQRLEASILDYQGEPAYAQWFWQWTFAATAATIVSGAVAERASFLSYAGYSILLTGFVYPLIVRWHWSGEGWNSPFNYKGVTGRGARVGNGAIDFAGSGVVHMVGGVAALVAAFFTGPRIGRFDAEGKVNPMPGHSATLITLGTFLLWFGWYGFNPGSFLMITGPTAAQITGRVAFITTLGAAVGGVAQLFMQYLITRQLDLINVCNGVLCGLVSITAGCSVIEPWAACIVGGLSAPVFTFFSYMLKKMRIDDVVDAFAMHGGCGMLALIFTGLLARPDYVKQVYGLTDYYGALYVNSTGMLLLCQLIEIGTIFGTVGFSMSVWFGVLRIFKLQRVKESDELAGLDVSKHGGNAYPDANGNKVHPDNFQKGRPNI